MATNCEDAAYEIKKTDSSQGSIVVIKGQVDEDSLDITLLGKRRREYGEVFNENLLHILENFASPEDSGNPGNPDTSITTNNILTNPTIGQHWFNSTNKRIYHWTGLIWQPLQQIGDVAGNSGTLLNGQQIPRPVSAITGYVFPYSECSWVIGPSGYDVSVDWMQCYTDSQGNVTFEYRRTGTTTVLEGIVNYQIIGIRGNNNLGDQETPIQVSPTPTPSPSSSLVTTPTPTPTPTPSTSQGVSPTPTPTPSVTSSITPTPTPSTSQGASPTPTPTNTPTPTPTGSNTPTPTPTSSVTPTPTSTPTPTPSNSALAPLTATGDNGTAFSVCPDSSVAEAIGTFTVSGGSGDYTITTGSCVHTTSAGWPAGSACDNLVININNGAGTATASLAAVNYTNCNSTGVRRATQTFNVTDNITLETASASVIVEQEVSGTN